MNLDVLCLTDSLSSYLTFPHINQATRDIGAKLIAEIELQENLIRSMEGAVLEFLAEVRQSIVSSDTRLRVLCNVNNPVVRIPDDVLSCIMEEARAAVRPSERVEVTLSHVCSRWRRTAISTSSLWTRVGPNSCQMMEAYLDRAKGQLIDIDLELGSLMDITNWEAKLATEQILARIANCSLRFRSLTIISLDTPFTPRSPHPIPFLKDVSSVPNLQSLKLILEPPTTSKEYFVPSKHPRLFHDGAPNLTQLHFQTTNMELIWFLPSLENLTSLTIGSLERPYPILPRPTIPMRVILSLPKLKQLALIDDAPSRRPACYEFGQNVPVASLWSSRLRSLRVPLRFLPDMFNKFPLEILEETTHLFVDVVYQPERPPLIDLTHCYLPQQPTRPMLPKLTQLTLCFEQKGIVDFPLPIAIVHLLCQLSPGITNLVLLKRACELLDPTVPWRMWPNLENVYFDIKGYYRNPSSRRTNFIKGLACLLVELARWRREQGSLTFGTQVKKKSFKYLKESGVPPQFWGNFQVVSGPTLPDGDIFWLS